MSFLADRRARNILQIVLTVVIVILGVVLYEVIRAPQREFAREQALTEQSRQRMHLLRRALMTFEREYTGFPTTLDSLEHVIRNDSFFIARRDSIFQIPPGETLIVDSLFYAARGPRFHYRGAFDDTVAVWMYVLRNPVTRDSIGTLDPERAGALRHTASWE
jgi:hypothetical protein